MSTWDQVRERLERYRLREVGRGRWRCNSPFRPGSDSHAFALVIEDGEHGAYYDHVSGEEGSLYELAERLGLTPPRRTVENSKRSYADLEDYAKAHGISAEALRQAGWQETHYEGRPALAFVTRTGQRWRFLDGKSPVYKSPVGYEACWYGLNKAAALARAQGRPLILCNGEISTVVAAAHGLPACCVTGGEKALPERLIDELKREYRGEIVIAFDCDATGQQAARVVKQQLSAFYSVQIVDLKLGPKGDLADWCHLEGKAASDRFWALRPPPSFAEIDVPSLQKSLRDLVAARQQDQPLDVLLTRVQRELDQLRGAMNESATVLSLAEVINLNHQRLNERRRNPDQLPGLHSHLPGLDRLVGGWAGGRLYVLYGDTNMGKSTLAVSLVCDWIRQSPGLIVPTESPTEAYVDKLAACLANVRYDKIETGRLTEKEYLAVMDAYIFLEEQECSVLQASSPTPAMIEAALRPDHHRWVLVDSMSKMKAEGERDIYNTTRLVADGLQDLCTATRVPFLVTCQVGRNLKDRAVKKPQVWDALGAGTVEQNADVVLSLYRHDHYVKLGVCDADARFPPGSALVQCLKHRWKDAVGEGVLLTFVGGVGLYELRQADDVVAAI